MYTVTRSQKNPLLLPSPHDPRQAVAALNGCPIQKDGATYLVYRAIGRPDPLVSNDAPRSCIGIAKEQPDGTFAEERILFEGNESYDMYACEDPRVTYFEGKYYIFYTAISGVPFGPSTIKAACAISSDLITIESRHLVTPFNAKAMTLFPERIEGKVTLILTAHTDEPPAVTAIAQADSIEEFFTEDYWTTWHANLQSQKLILSKTSDDHNEVGAPPLLTKDGWLLIYSRAQHYFTPEKRLFTIEAVVLDKVNPLKIVYRTRNPILVPEAAYERFGLVRDVVFPSGLIYNETTDVLSIFYGAGDTVCAKANLVLSHLLTSMREEELVTRAPRGPILKPLLRSKWQNVAVFNPAAIKIDDTTYILYRAMGSDNTSVVGLAVSQDGYTVSERLPDPIYLPRESFEMKKAGDNTFSGCEDPRITCIDNTLYMLYTAYNGVDEPRVAITSISKTDFLDRAWEKWHTPHLISPPGISDKDACLVSETVKGEYVFLHRINGQLCADTVPSIEPLENIQLSKCIDVLQPRPGFWDSRKIGLASPPLHTSAGWLLLYHGISEDGTYSLGAALMDTHDPTVLIGRGIEPIMFPHTAYEHEGIIPHVVFPCGAVLQDDTLFIYYGGGDKVVHVATCSLSLLMNRLQPVPAK